MCTNCIVQKSTVYVFLHELMCVKGVKKRHLRLRVCVRMPSVTVLSWKCMAVYLDDLMVRPSSNEEKQKHCVGQKAQWAGWGHSEITACGNTDALANMTGLGNYSRRNPKNRTVKSCWAVRQESRPAEVQPKRDLLFPSGLQFSTDDMKVKRAFQSRECIS